MADESKPSWCSSTLSQLTSICTISFLIGAGVAALGIIFFKLPIEQAKQVLEPFSWLTGLFVTAYLTARKTDNGGVRHEPPPQTPA